MEKERALYLRRIATGEIQGPSVGYPSIDKPWLADYSEDDLLSDIHYRRIYSEFRIKCWNRCYVNAKLFRKI